MKRFLEANKHRNDFVDCGSQLFVCIRVNELIRPANVKTRQTFVPRNYRLIEKT